MVGVRKISEMVRNVLHFPLLYPNTKAYSQNPTILHTLTFLLVFAQVKKPRSEEAKRLLEKLACACAPLMVS